MAEFPIEPSLANVILQGYKRGCHESVLKVISMLPSGDRVFYKSKEKKEDTPIVKAFKAMNSDFEMLEAIFDTFNGLDSYKTRKDFCMNNGLN